MPHQETFLQREVNGHQIRVVKSYDVAFAREAFEQMDPNALAFLRHSLHSDAEYEDAELPLPSDPEFGDAIWDEIEASAREDWNTFSYFVVLSATNGVSRPLYVSPDWPSAEAFCAEFETLAAVNHGD